MSTFQNINHHKQPNIAKKCQFCFYRRVSECCKEPAVVKDPFQLHVCVSKAFMSTFQNLTLKIQPNIPKKCQFCIFSRVLERCKGTVVVQDPFQLDFCVTKAYLSTAWRHCCNNLSRITSKWMENGKGGLISEGIFNLVPSTGKLNYSPLFQSLVSCITNPESTNITFCWF